MKNENSRTFYTIILTQTLSMIGSRVSSLALGIWLYAETGNATPLALVAFFTMVPGVIMQGFAGVLADRWDRRYVMGALGCWTGSRNNLAPGAIPLRAICDLASIYRGVYSVDIRSIPGTCIFSFRYHAHSR